MKLTNIRKLYLLGLFFISCVIAISYYLQYSVHIQPCPLCLLQRFTLILLAGLFLLEVSIPLKKWGAFGLHCFCNMLSGIGLLLAGRQIWIQYLPSSVTTDCGASLKYLMHILPIHQVILKVFEGTAECTKVDWKLLHLSLAEWSFLVFLGLFLFTGWSICHSIMHHKNIR